MNKVIAFTLGLFVFISVSAFGQNYEPNTLIMKVKREFADKCKSNEVQIPALSQILKSEQIEKVEKTFPLHKKEKASHKIDLSTIYTLKLNPSLNLHSVQSILEKSPYVKYIEPLYTNQLAYTPSDTEATKQWYLGAIDAFRAWDVETGDTNVVIGIVDTGSDLDHPDLVNDFAYNYADPINGVDDDQDGYIDNFNGWDVANNDNQPGVNLWGHGTNVAGIASASTDNTTGISGVGFNTKILNVKIDDANTGALTAAYAGMVYAADHGAFIINNSWGSFIFSQFAQDIVNYCAINRGALVIGAVGNNGADTLFYPAAYDNVLSVGSLLPGDTLKPSSNYGYYVDIYAPGEDMWTCNAIGGYQYNGGTSMAAPVVAGAAALVKSQNPAFTAKQVALQLQRTSDNLETINAATYKDKLGSGKVNMYRALTESPSGIVFENIEVTDQNDNSYVAGDTLRVRGDFVNYLASASNINIQIEIGGNLITPLNNTLNISSLVALDTFKVRSTPFTFLIPSGLQNNQTVDFLIRIKDGNTNAKQHFSIYVNQDFINTKANDLELSITSDGSIGFTGNSAQFGKGIIYKTGPSLLYEGSFALAISPQNVADKFRSPIGIDNDFGKDDLIRQVLSAYAKEQYAAQFVYPGTGSPQLEIFQNSFLFDNDSLSSTVIHTYRIKNVSSISLNQLYAGLFADWDVLNYQNNKIGYDSSRAMGIAYASDTNLYCGIRALGNEHPTSHYAIDLVPGGNGGIDILGGFTDALKFTALSNRRDSAGISTNSGNDVLDVNSIGPFNLAPDSSTVISFSITISSSLTSLQEMSDSASSSFKKLALSLREPSIQYSKSLLLFPNPANNQLDLRFRLDKAESLRLDVINLKGQKVLSKDLGKKSRGNQTVRLNTESLSNGIYLLQLNGDNLKIENKFVIAH